MRSLHVWLLCPRVHVRFGLTDHGSPVAVTPFEKREYRDRCPAEPPVGLLALVRSLSGLRQGKHITVRVFEPRHLRSACLRADQRSDSLPVPVLRTPLVLLIHTRPRKSWTASACLCVHHPLTRLCHPLKRTGSEDGKRPKPDSCAWVVNLAYPERSFVVILPSWRPPAQHNTPTATFRPCVLPVPVLRSPLILLIRRFVLAHQRRQRLRSHRQGQGLGWFLCRVFYHSGITGQ